MVSPWPPNQAALDCKPVSASHSCRYRKTYGTLEEETGLTPPQKKDRQEKIEVSCAPPHGFSTPPPAPRDSWSVHLADRLRSP